MTVQKYISGGTAVNIAGSVESALAGGHLGPGTLLPAVRALADHLRVSPATVASAYRMLQDRGVVVADGRRGTRVRPMAPISLPREAPLPAGVRDLSDGNPDPALLPDLDLALRRLEMGSRLYGEELNDAELLELAREQFAADGIPNANVSIVSGAMDGIERVLREHLRAGDRVAVEDPGFTGILDLLNALSLVAVPVPLDDEGILPNELKKAIRSCDALIVTPRAQNPSGAAFTARRARELRRVLAARPELLLLEDDHAGVVAGAGYLSIIDKSREKWAVVRSVSKSFGPDLRVALLAADHLTHARVEGRQNLGVRWVSHILQRLVVLLARDRAPQKAGRIYTERRNALLAALRNRNIPAFGASGLNVWIPVPEETATVQALMHEGWAVKAGERYRIATPSAIRVTISTLEPKDALRFADALANVIAPRSRTSGA
ncbi:MAG TPA: aminotransferase class I/II-fold pyridoxal phosphate-dependent enzyme [Thermoanaerobaculia bacterium]|nr:aminotransferase class I/II-fold pyridoxal phosphate-dependent enzyme [Thermoanaerobaculia bacterium]